MDMTNDNLSVPFAPDNARARRRQLLRRELFALLVVLALALLALANLKRVEVSGISMYPTFHNGQNVVVWKHAPRSLLSPGDIIVCKSPDGVEVIKRIVFVANPNAPARFPPLGFPPVLHSSVDGQEIPSDNGFDPYFAAINAHAKPAPPRTAIFYVMGDNWARSLDSRDFGPVRAQDILGKVIR